MTPAPSDKDVRKPPPQDESGDLLLALEALLPLLQGSELEQTQELQRQIEALQKKTEAQFNALRESHNSVDAKMEALRNLAREVKNQSFDLQTEVDIMRRKAQVDAEGLIERIAPILSDMISRTIRDSRDEMAEAIGPLMGEAIRVQIRDSRKDMVEALYPVIGETVQKSVAESVREFQRNIDAQLKKTFGPEGILRAAFARLRGVSPAQLAMRDALPFSIKEIFLIQRETGLLLAHSHPGSSDIVDSDIISGMLTAIRDFVKDSFGQGKEDKELDEIQYGDQRVIIQSGRAAYLAVVITGVEPEGFRARLHNFISDLHVKHESALKKYSGDSSSLPNLQPKIARLIAESGGQESGGKKMSPAARGALAGVVLLGILFIATACFYLQFTIALYPVAFPSATPTNTSTPTATATATSTATATATPTATATATPTATFTPTFTPTPTFTFTPSATPTPFSAISIGNVWLRNAPDPTNSSHIDLLLANTPITILSLYGNWIEIEWRDSSGYHHGWTPAQWIFVFTAARQEHITPTP
ncbi:MAG: hypothetical protein Fur002_00820 [Anaerolineales bacterium]